MSRTQISCLVVLLLAGCAAQSPAPIIDRSASASVPPPVLQPVSPVLAPVAPPAPGTYVVKRGDTLYRIALDHGLAYGDLANWNGLEDVNDIKVDQVLRLMPPEAPAGVEVRPLRDAPAPVASTRSTPERPLETLSYPKAVKLPFGSQAAETIGKQADGPIKTTDPLSTNKQAAEKPLPAAASPAVSAEIKTQEKSGNKEQMPATTTGDDVVEWMAPTAGKLLKTFTEESKGIDFSGKMGQPVLAAGSGRVVYAGSGLRGYGKMVIIKHNNTYLSAYAHNSKLLVKEGDTVKRGEKIAEMGNSDTDQVKLHFEIRQFGKPVDPTKFITADK